MRPWLSGYALRLDVREYRGAFLIPPGRDSTSGPSFGLHWYAGVYRDAWYGDVRIEREAAGLVIRFTRTPSLVGDLVHWQHDTFLARWRDRELRADAWATFALGPDGRLAEVRMAPAADRGLQLRLSGPAAAAAPA